MVCAKIGEARSMRKEHQDEVDRILVDVEERERLASEAAAMKLSNACMSHSELHV